MSRARKIAFMGIFTALAMVLSYVESLIAITTPLPFFKLGLANTVILSALYLFGAGNALIISIIRVVTLSILFTGPGGLIYSLFGAMLSFGAMATAKKSNAFSIIGVSILGGLCHNMGQLIAAILVTANFNISLFLLPLVITGALTGMLTGFVSKLLIERIRPVIGNEDSRSGKNCKK